MKLTCLLMLLTIAPGLSAAPVAASSLIESPQTGGLQLKSLSSISFGPEGLLLVA
jgi:hypothetical protein